MSWNIKVIYSRCMSCYIKVIYSRCMSWNIKVTYSRCMGWNIKFIYSRCMSGNIKVIYSRWMSWNIKVIILQILMLLPSLVNVCNYFDITESGNVKMYNTVRITHQIPLGSTVLFLIKSFALTAY
jgi:hypothetical protein